MLKKSAQSNDYLIHCALFEYSSGEIVCEDAYKDRHSAIGSGMPLAFRWLMANVGLPPREVEKGVNQLEERGHGEMG